APPAAFGEPLENLFEGRARRGRRADVERGPRPEADDGDPLPGRRNRAKNRLGERARAGGAEKGARGGGSEDAQGVAAREVHGARNITRKRERGQADGRTPLQSYSRTIFARAAMNATMRSVPMPPETTATDAPSAADAKRLATKPASSSPSCGPPMKKTMFTPVIRPRNASGVTSCRTV